MADLPLLLTRARRGYLRYRRWLVAAAAAGAVLAAVQELAPPEPATTPVVVAVRDLAPGHRLGADDLAVEDMPSDAAPPEGLLSRADLLGERVAGPVAAGEPVTATRVVGSGLFERLGPGLLATPVRLPDADIAGLLHAGDRVDVYAATGDASEPAVQVVRDATVVVVPEHGEDSRAQGAVVVLALTELQSAELAQAGATTQLAVSVRGGSG
jgi:Flp pilus assembly protein CpaB